MEQHTDKPFREIALEKLTATLGQPQVLKVEGDRAIYRWRLPRAHNMNVAVYVTLDSPELPQIAHLLISDPAASELEPIVSVTVRTLPELEAVIQTILRQWKR